MVWVSIKAANKLGKIITGSHVLPNEPVQCTLFRSFCEKPRTLVSKQVVLLLAGREDEISICCDTSTGENFIVSHACKIIVGLVIYNVYEISSAAVVCGEGCVM